MTDRPLNLAPLRPARRRWWYWPVGALGLLILAVIAGYVALPTLAERWAEGWFARNGAPDADVEIGEWGRDRAVIDTVSLGGEPDDTTARQITIDYRLDGFAVPVIEQVSIAELNLAVDPTDETRPLGVLSDLIASLADTGTGDDTGDGSTDAEIPPIAIETATIGLPTFLGGAAVRLSGLIRQEAPDLLIADLTVDADATNGGFTGSLRVETDFDANGTVRLIVEQGSAHFGTPTAVEIPHFAGTSEIAFADAAVTGGKIRMTAPDVVAAGWPGAGLRVTGELDGERWAAHIATDGPAAGLDGSVDIEAPQLAPDNFKIAANLSLEAGAPWWALFGLPTPTEGLVTIDADGDIAAGATSALSATTLPAGALTLAVSMDGMNWPGRLTALDAIGAIDATIRNNGVELTASSPLLVDAVPDPEWLAAIGAGNLGITDPGLLSAEIEPGARATWSPADGGSLDIAGAASLSAIGPNTLDASLAGGLHFAPIDNLQSFKATTLDLQVGGLTIDREGWRASVGTLTAAGSAVGTPDDWSAELLLAGQLAIAGNGFRIDGFDFELPTLVRQAGDTTTLHTADGGTMTLARPGIGTMPYRIDRIRARLGPSEEPLLTRDCPTPAGCTLTYRGQFAVDAIALHSDTVTDAIGTGPATIRIEGSLSPDGTAAGTIGFDAGQVRFSEWGASADALRIRATFSDSGRIAFEGRAGNLTGANLDAWLPPMGVRFVGSIVRSTVNFDTHLADENEWVVVDASGTHRLDDNSGTASIDMQPIQFRPGGLQPWDIAPALETEIDEATGRVTLDGSLSWSGGRVASDLVLRLEDLSIVAPQADLARLNGAIALQSLAPLISQPDQQVSIAQIDIGIPLTDALITFSILEGPLFAIENARFGLAGGRVETAPVVFDPSDPDTTIELHVTDMNLGAFLALAEVEGLAATGQLTGTIPVEIRDNAIVIAAGRLDAEGPGTLRYAPAQPPAALQGAGETASLVLGALADFRYDQLWLTLDREADGETGLGLHVRGSNPDFYDGYPIELNLSLTGELDRILRDSLVGYRIPDYVKDQLEDGEDAESGPDINAGDSP